MGNATKTAARDAGHLQNYQFALKQRNELLKQIRSKGASVELLDAWDDLLVADGIALIQARAKILAQLKVHTQAKHADLTGDSENLDLTYQPLLDGADRAMASDIDDQFRRALQSSRHFDIRRGTTSVGPHRDDFKLVLEAQSAGTVYRQEARSFGSQGQQRTIALALKLGELELLREETEETPVVLLDDVFSELDEARSTFLFELLRRLNAQTFITSTRPEVWTPELGDCCVFTVQDGKVR